MRAARLGLITACVACAVGAPPARVDEGLDALPEAYACNFENDRVRVCEVTVAGGARVPMHRHPEHLARVLTAGRLVISTPDGASTEWSAEAGYTAWAPAETHALRNPGSETVRALIVEFKPPPARTRR